MRLLITGGSGFIGTNLIDGIILRKDTSIVNIDIKMPIKQEHKHLWKKFIGLKRFVKIY